MFTTHKKFSHFALRSQKRKYFFHPWLPEKKKGRFKTKTEQKTKAKLGECLPRNVYKHFGLLQKKISFKYVRWKGPEIFCYSISLFLQFIWEVYSFVSLIIMTSSEIVFGNRTSSLQLSKHISDYEDTTCWASLSSEIVFRSSQHSRTKL